MLLLGARCVRGMEIIAVVNFTIRSRQMRERRNAFRALVGNPRGMRHTEEAGVGRRIILKLMNLISYRP